MCKIKYGKNKAFKKIETNDFLFFHYLTHFIQIFTAKCVHFESELNSYATNHTVLSGDLIPYCSDKNFSLHLLIYLKISS